LCGFVDLGDFQRAHHQWVEQALENGRALRDDRWSEAIAVGSLAFVETVKNDLGIRATHREVLPADGTYALREASEP
jgi:putative transposase